MSPHSYDPRCRSCGGWHLVSEVCPPGTFQLSQPGPAFHDWFAESLEDEAFIAARSAFWCLAQVGLILTMGVLATRLNDYASCPVEPYHGTPIHTSEEIQGVLWAALEPVQGRL